MNKCNTDGRRWLAPAVYLIGITLSALVILLVIFHFGDIPNKHNNGFKRAYFPASYSAAHELDLPDTLSWIVGLTRSNMYIGISTEGEVVEVRRDLKGSVKRIQIPFFSKFYDSLQLSSANIKIDSPFIYLFAENKPAIVKTAFDSSLFEIRILPPGPFTREVMVGSDCFVLRKIEPRLTDQLFVRYDFATGSIKKEDSISEIFGDGGIVSDGQLYFDVKAKKLCYIYYYKNLLLSFDTSLNLAERWSTIDTTTSFRIKTGIVKNEGTTAYTNISPANIINKLNDVKNGFLFNMSALKADNESDRFFSDNSIIDIIDLKNGGYLGSIHLPVFDGNKLSGFVISDNQLIGLYAHTIIIYDLSAALSRYTQ